MSVLRCRVLNCRIEITSLQVLAPLRVTSRREMHDKKDGKPESSCRTTDTYPMNAMAYCHVIALLTMIEHLNNANSTESWET